MTERCFRPMFQEDWSSVDNKAGVSQLCVIGNSYGRCVGLCGRMGDCRFGTRQGDEIDGDETESVDVWWECNDAITAVGDGGK